jgi:hypothetical protein
VRGFSKTDISIHYSDIDIIILLKEEFRPQFKELIDIFVCHYQAFIKIEEDRSILSVPMILFYREFKAEHFHKFTEWGIPFIMEAELLYGKELRPELGLARSDMQTSLVQNLTYHLARYYERLTETIHGEGYVRSLMKRARRVYFFYTWCKHRKYIMNTQEQMVLHGQEVHLVIDLERVGIGELIQTISRTHMIKDLTVHQLNLEQLLYEYYQNESSSAELQGHG